MEASTASSRLKRNVAVAAAVVVVLVAGASFEVDRMQRAPTVPKPSSSVNDYSCHVVDSSSPGGPATVSLNGSSIVGSTLLVSSSADFSILPTTCSYYSIQKSAPFRCGTMCGGWAGYVQVSGIDLNLNFSVTSVTGGNLFLKFTSIGGGVPLGFLAFGNAHQMWLNSQKVTWYSIPPCMSEEGVESNCMGVGAEWIIVDLPALSVGSQNELLINDTTTLVP